MIWLNAYCVTNRCICIFLGIFPISFKGKGISFKNLVQVEKKNEEKKSKELKLL